MRRSDRNIKRTLLNCILRKSETGHFYPWILGFDRFQRGGERVHRQLGGVGRSWW
jgi:hypothetical protein